MPKRNYVLKVRADVGCIDDNPPIYFHTFEELEPALAALRELHRDYAKGEWLITFRSYETL